MMKYERISIFSVRRWTASWFCPMYDITDHLLSLHLFRPCSECDMSTLRFGQHLIKASAVFLQTELSFALVNRKPVVPGRILNHEVWGRPATKDSMFQSLAGHVEWNCWYVKHVSMCRRIISALYLAAMKPWIMVDGLVDLLQTHEQPFLDWTSIEQLQINWSLHETLIVKVF